MAWPLRGISMTRQRSQVLSLSTFHSRACRIHISHSRSPSWVRRVALIAFHASSGFQGGRVVTRADWLLPWVSVDSRRKTPEPTRMATDSLTDRDDLT